MTDLLIRPDVTNDPRKVHVADGPIDFQTWISLTLDCAQAYDTELISGVMVDKMSAQLPHEWIFAWVFRLLSNYVEKSELGTVLGSRTAVKISDFDGRLPDILFVRAENAAILHKDAIYGAPDLVIEIVSPNDRPSDLIPLETDYRTLGVQEILFIDPQKERVRVVQKTDGGYSESFLYTGRLELRTVPGFWLEVDWLFTADRPKALDVALELLKEQNSAL